MRGLSVTTIVGFAIIALFALMALFGTPPPMITTRAWSAITFAPCARAAA